MQPFPATIRRDVVRGLSPLVATIPCWHTEAPWSAHLFSEGNALHLWQIRYFPNYRQTLLKASFAGLLISGFAVTLWNQNSLILGQTETVEKVSTEGDRNSSAAEEFLNQVRQELPKHQTIKAELNQSVSIGDQNFTVSGEYLSAGQKLRLHYTVSPNQSAKGEILEVCDGKELWTKLELPDMPVKVTHRNVRQIIAAAKAIQQEGIAESAISVELGLGGIAALLASLERTMDFDAMKTEEANGVGLTIVQGRWKKQFRDRLPKEKKDGEELLPAYIPDLVRVYVNRDTLFPERLVYLKKQASKRTFKALTSLEFTNIEFDKPIDEELFVFPQSDTIIPEDVTKMYIERMKPPQAPAAQK